MLGAWKENLQFPQHGVLARHHEEALGKTSENTLVGMPLRPSSFGRENVKNPPRNLGAQNHQPWHAGLLHLCTCSTWQMACHG
jgi:hypothetical protein